MSSGDARPPLPRPPVFQRKVGGAGIFTSCPSPSPCGYGLGPDLPYAVYRSVGILGLSAPRVFTGVVATHSGILTPLRSTVRSQTPSLHRGRSPTTRPRRDESAASAADLAPGHLRRRNPRPVSCYALPRGMAASKPTSRLSGDPHILSHSVCTSGP